MKINGREVNGRKRSSNSSMNSFLNNSFSKNVSSTNNITQMNNLRDIIREFSRSRVRQNAKFEKTVSKIIFVLIFGPMILNLVISIISALFLGIKN